MYVPDDTSGSGKLYISEGAALESHIYVYDVPHKSETLFKEGSLNPIRELNSNLMTQNLEEPKIASMHYFEGVLYVIHDNARVIRSWNLKNGEQMAEYVLPAVDGGFSKQWEGMGLLRTGAAARDYSSSSDQQSSRGGVAHNLRRTSQQAPAATLKLYLTLDTPPQVWSIGITEGNGGLIFPDCAQMRAQTTNGPVGSAR